MLYWYIFKFRFARFLAYPFEIAANIFKRAIEVGIIIFLWSLVLKNSDSGQSVREIASYFLIAVGIGEIVMAKWGPLGSTIAKSVRQGTLSNFLIKPTPLIPTIYFTSLGFNGLRTLVALISIIIGIILVPPQSAVAIILFIIFFITAFAVAFAYNIFLGTMYFHIGDAGGIKNSIEHMSRVLSGALVPLIYFPLSVQPIVKLLPFQAMIYAPANAFTINTIDSAVIASIAVSVFWAVVLNVLMFKFWRYSIKNYEASGI